MPISKTILPCLNEDTVNKLFNDIGVAYNKSAKGTLTDVLNVTNQTFLYYGNLPQDAQDCLAGNEEIPLFLQKYNINDPTDLDALYKTYITFLTLHYLNLHK